MKHKKLLSVLLIVAMLCSIVTPAAFAGETETGNVAKIGDTEYATFAEAVKDVPKNTPTTITLLQDTTASVMVGHQYVQNITVDLGGHTLSGSGIVLTSYRNGTTLTVQNGTICGNSSSGTLRANNGGAIRLGEGLTVKGAGGGATLVYVDNGSVDIIAKGGVVFTGGKQDIKLSTHANNKVTAVAIGRTYFSSLADAFAAANDGDTIQLYGDITQDGIATNTKDVTLDLNGKTITGTDNTSENFSLIDNRGELTITGNGTMTLTATVNSGWNRYSAVIANNPGGKLIVENGTIQHLGGTDMAYGIDNLTNGRCTYAETVINGGTIESTYRAIRQFLNGIEAENILTINGGTIEGDNKSVWMQDPNKNANSGTLTVTAEAILIGDVYLFVTEGSKEWPVEVSIVASAVGGEVQTANLPSGYAVSETNGVYGVVNQGESDIVAKIKDSGYTTLADAFAEAENGDVIKLVNNINLGETVKNIATVTLDLNGRTITGIDNNTSGNFYLINNEKGNLTITDSVGNGKITLEANTERNWTASSVVVANNLGTVTLEAGTIEHLGGTSMAYGIDNLTNGKNTVATLNIEGGKVDSTYFAIRQFANNGTNNLNISGGEVSYAWMQSPNADKNVANISVTGGKVDGICLSGANADVTMSVAPGTTGEVYGTAPAGMEITGSPEEGFGLIAEAAIVAKIGETGYTTLEEAVKAVPKDTSTTITLLQDYSIAKNIMVGYDYPQNITIDLNEHTISKGDIALTSYRNGTTLTVMNGTISGNSSSGTLRANNGGKIILGEGLTVKGAGGSATLVYVDNGSVEVAAENGVTFDGGKVDFKLSDKANNKVNAVGIDRKYYGTLKKAIEVAENNEVITLVDDITVDADDAATELDGKYYTFFRVAGKTITIDLNGKKVYGDATALNEMLVGIFSTEENGHLTLKDSSEAKTGTVEVKTGDEQNPANALIINYDDTSSITINGGNYYLDYSNNALVDTRSNERVTVNGGTFKLGNLGTLANGSPWIFNAKGQNERHVLVNGGTFQSDVAHQYYPFEVSMPKEKALTKVDDMYTVTDAVAYVTEREWSSKWYTNEVGYATLKEAFAACEGPQTKVYYKKDYVSEQEEVVLLDDICIDADDTITIPAGKTVVLDLNNQTLSGTADGTGNREMFLVKGELTVKNGTVEMTATKNQEWNAMATIFDVTAGGVLNMDGVTATVGGTDMNFIVHLNNWGEVTLNVNDCDFTAPYVAVRVFNSGYDMNNITIKDTDFHNGRVFWVHNYTSESKDDSTLNLDIYSNGNTTDNVKPVRFGFSNSVYYNLNGDMIVENDEKM